MNQWLVPILVAFATPILTFLGIARRLSGRIETSEASQLWEEAASIRKDYRERIEKCEQTVQHLRNELETCHDRNSTLRVENQDLRLEIRKYRL